jgi:L-serine dehydratase
VGTLEGISIFDIFKVGVGPSSSHTLGPWKASLDFIENLDHNLDQIQVQLFGSLSKTGVGHATDKAVQLGLSGFHYETIVVSDIDNYLKEIERNQSIQIRSQKVSFHPKNDIIFENDTHDLHPNTLIINGIKDGSVVCSQVYASVGGGFIERENEARNNSQIQVLPHPIDTGKDIIAYTDKMNCEISELVLINEESLRSREDVVKGIDQLIDVMLDSVYLGCHGEGKLPGGLDVKRRAHGLHLSLIGDRNYENRSEWLKAVKSHKKAFNEINQWISCFALAVNEENAAMSRVVTSPTNGAAGVIPAVMLYFFLFCDYQDRDQLRNFLLTASEIGSLFKKGATISAAVGGCQAEIGVSSAMAAAGLTEVLGGSPRQALMAAEIAMEHHLGLTCDPVGGLVQIPCIERNAMGAIKAITAANLALSSDPSDAKVDIDTVIKTMWDTAQEMNGKYKETSEGGLAFNLPVFYPEC